ncbi:MAG: hypothetical protein RL318_504 [Fibrobacterota bacterium]|jgi:phosphate transport system permease protein
MMERGKGDRIASASFFLLGLPATLAIPAIVISLFSLAHPSGLSLALSLVIPSLVIAGIALAFSAPLGIGAALFTSEFLHFRQRRPVTLLLEGLGALPPVCAAWIATLILAPWWDAISLPLFVFFILTPAVFSMASLATPLIPVHLVDRLFGPKLALLCSVLLGGCLLACIPFFRGASVLPPIHSSFGAGIAISLFLAPKVAARVLFHLTRIPDHLREASLTCGATRWETARRVVVPRAILPIGFTLLELMAWASGETMVVLVLCGSPAQAPWGGATLASALVLGLPESIPSSIAQGGLLWSALALLILSVLAQIPTALREPRP